MSGTIPASAGRASATRAPSPGIESGTFPPEVKKRDEGLRKRDPEVKERDELNGLVKDANAELRKQPQRPQQQRQVLKGSQRAMKGSVSHIITVGLRHSNK
jgi:hypothetical protein